MEVKMNTGDGTNYSVNLQGQARTPNAEAVSQEKQESQPGEQLADKTSVDSENLKKSAEEMTKWVQGLNTNIKFAVHEETNQLMVQVIDIVEQKVLREFPPRDYLDMIAKIREFVGMLLDKKV